MTPIPSPRSPPVRAFVTPSPCTPATSLSWTTPSWTPSSPGAPSSEGSLRSRRSASSPPCAGRVATGPWLDVPDIVLVDDSLGALLPTRRQGRRIISGIAISAQVFLTRVATQALVIATITMLGLGFPYSPAQTGLTLFTVGLPTAFLTAWARPGAPDRHLLINLARFVLPAAVITAGAGVGVYTLFYTGITHGFTDPAIQCNMVAEFE